MPAEQVAAVVRLAAAALALALSGPAWAGADQVTPTNEPVSAQTACGGDLSCQRQMQAAIERANPETPAWVQEWATFLVVGALALGMLRLFIGRDKK